MIRRYALAALAAVTLSLVPDAVHALEGAMAARDAHIHALRTRALRSVVRITFDLGRKEESICTGTVLANRILLTARHCFARHASGPFIVDVEGAAYEATRVEMPVRDHLVSVPRRIRELSDVALLLVTSKGRDVLSDRPVLALARAEQLPHLSREILMAGYGRDQIEIGSSGKLLSGVNTRIDRISQLRGRRFFDDAEIDLSLRKVLPGEFVTYSVREDQAVIQVKAGMKIEEQPLDVQLETVRTDGTASLLEGDSGGPAIAFDEDHVPFIVGVASGYVPDRSNLTRSVQLIGPNGEAIYREELPTIEGPTEGSDLLEPELLGRIFSSAAQAGWVDLDARQTRADFKIVEDVRRLTQSIYTSVTSELNQTYIREALARLEAERDR